MINELYKDSIDLLRKMISVPSFSREEDDVVETIIDFLNTKELSYERSLNNIILKSPHWKNRNPTLLLNSHIDTVKASEKWTKNPFIPVEEEGRLYGLGSNDAGASVVSLLAAFRFLIKKKQKYNIVLLISAEEEISGKNGIEHVLKELPPISFGIAGEPTQMQMAVAEKGLMVLDCVCHGESGHAARSEGVNAIYLAMQEIEWFKCFNFPEQSNYLGDVKMSVTQINAGSQHNVVPDRCHFVVDVRTTDRYSNEEILHIIKENTICDVTPRSTRLNSSFAPIEHPIIVSGQKNGMTTFGSPTLSDMALMPFPSLKIGPGNSARSHTADEYIRLDEIKEGIEKYIKILHGLEL